MVELFAFPGSAFLLSAVGAIGLIGGGVLAYVAAARARLVEDGYRAARLRLPAAAEDESVSDRVRSKRLELREVEERLTALRGEFGDAEKARAEAEHWERIIDLVKSDYTNLSQERREVDEVRDAYTRAAADLADERGRLEDARTKRDLLQRESEEIEHRLNAQREREDELRGLEERIAAGTIRLDTLRAEIAHTEDVRAELQRAHARYEEAERRTDAMQERLRQLEPAVAELEERKGLIAAEVEGLQAELQQLQPLWTRLAELEARQQALVAAIGTGERTAQDIEARVAHMRTDIGTLEELKQSLSADVERMQADVDRRQALAERSAELEVQHRVLEAAIAGRELELNRLQGAIDASVKRDQSGPEHRPAGVLADLLRQPSCLFADGVPLLRQAARETDEQAAIARVQTYMQDVGLDFDQRTLSRFHTSLKTSRISPLTVLAGISGTGKSQLPQRYSEAMGIHFLKLAVQPRWDSPQDLFGFYNYLEQSFKATELARALAWMDPHGELVNGEHGLRDHVMLVLLDEMNLARVEYYFSEFLSRLEGRPGPTETSAERLRASRIEIEVPGGEGAEQPAIYPGHNVLFVGTMNQDESTQALSDKVLDRANVLRFQRPPKLVESIPEGGGDYASAHLPFTTWAGWYREVDELQPANASLAKGFIDELNEHLDRMRRPFGHRVNQAILSYVVNHPDYRSIDGCRSALSDMMELRILPKLRGVEMDDRSGPALTQIEKLVRTQLDDGRLAGAIRTAATGSDMFDWVGLPPQ